MYVVLTTPYYIHHREGALFMSPQKTNICLGTRTLSLFFFSVRFES